MIEEKSSVWEQKIIILVILVLVTFMCLVKKGSHDVQEWDESRNGVNAYEMLQNGDYVNLYYNGEPDTWNAKPPLLIWSIAASYRIFGFNEFALRFPSTLCTIIFFILCFYVVKLLDNIRTAFFTCLVLMSCKAILGHHIGLTGDFDVLLLVFLTASVYTFILYVEKRRKKAVFFTAIFIGLAFYTKGPASLVLIPGFFLYIVLSKKTSLLRDVRLWAAVVIFLFIASSWILIAAKLGKTTDHSAYGSKNPAETMFLYDTYKRLTDSRFGASEAYDSNYLFFFEVIDARLNLWNYFFYPAILLGLYLLYKNKKNIISFISQDENRMVLLSLCLITPLSLVLSFASTKHNWYLAPIFMYVAFIVVKGLLFFAKKWKGLYVIAGILFLFCLSRHIYYICSLPTETHEFFCVNDRKIKNSSMVLAAEPPQVILLYLKWLNVKFIKPQEISSEISKRHAVLIFSGKDHPESSESFAIVPFLKFGNNNFEEIKNLNH